MNWIPSLINIERERVAEKRVKPTVKTTPGANDKWNKSKTEANNRPGGKYEPHMRIRERERRAEQWAEP
jgi:hypothetical protein